MQQYLTMQDFGGVGIIPLLKSIVTAIPIFFPMLLFLLWLFITAASYYAILNYTGRKRFWHAFTSVSFTMFIMSLLIAAMNEESFTFLSGYWVGFYLLWTVIAYILLDNYKE